jgi:hypothetical protein
MKNESEIHTIKLNIISIGVIARFIVGRILGLNLKPFMRRRGDIHLVGRLYEFKPKILIHRDAECRKVSEGLIGRM